MEQDLSNSFFYTALSFWEKNGSDSQITRKDIQKSDNLTQSPCPKIDLVDYEGQIFPSEFYIHAMINIRTYFSGWASSTGHVFTLPTVVFKWIHTGI